MVPFTRGATWFPEIHAAAPLPGLSLPGASLPEATKNP